MCRSLFGRTVRPRHRGLRAVRCALVFGCHLAEVHNRSIMAAIPPKRNQGSVGQVTFVRLLLDFRAQENLFRGDTSMSRIFATMSLLLTGFGVRSKDGGSL